MRSQSRDSMFPWLLLCDLGQGMTCTVLQLPSLTWDMLLQPPPHQMMGHEERREAGLLGLEPILQATQS